MRYLRAYFQGYIGFYLGLGLEELEIDLSKCTSGMVLILGKNACGKSTLMSHLNPFPDSSTSFVDNMKGVKELSLISNDGNRYDIHIESLPITGETKRKPTKAYIKKNGLELNPNGNVSSYKETVYTELELDSSYNSLFMLSSTNRGMGDKTPADRKMFVSSIIDNLEVYNNMYKTLNKKSLIFKSHINTIHTKIQNIGDRNALQIQFDALKLEHTKVSTQIASLRDRVVEINAKTNISVETREKIDQLEQSITSTKQELERLEVEIKNIKTKNKLVVEDDATNIINGLTDTINTFCITISHNQAEINSYNKRLEKVLTDIRDITANIIALPHKDDTDYDKYIRSAIEVRDRILSEWNSSLNTHCQGADICNETLPDKIQKAIDAVVFFQEYYRSVQERLDAYDVSVDFLPEFINNINAHKQIIDRENKLIEVYNHHKEKLMNIKDKPTDCENSNCPFISEGMKSLEECKMEFFGGNVAHPDIEKVIENCQHMIDKSLNIRNIEEAAILKETNISSIITEINKIWESKIGDISIFLDPSGYQLRDIIDYMRRTLELEQQYQDEKNIVVSYQQIKREYEELLKKQEEAKNISKLHGQYQSMLSSLERERNELKTNISNIEVDTHNIQKTSHEYTEKCNIYKQYQIVYDNIQKAKEQLQLFSEKYDLLTMDIKNSRQELERISEYNNQIQELSKRLIPLEQDSSRIMGQLTLLDSYYQEYNEYNMKYEMIEKIKKYCSPSKGGIQTIFMQIYMSKTLELANDLLRLLFNGEYQLADFIINEKEFRIPFYNNGMIVDDISNGSMSQVCMMGMIINLVLSYQGSTKYNIPALDEPDANLDSPNRSIFMPVIWKAKEILQIDQMFVISHSLEEDMNGCDIIKLKTFDEYQIPSNMNANIIYDYEQVIRDKQNI